MEPSQEPLRQQVITACEACRAAKVKCQASYQLGICARCLDSKRECIFKTGRRTRRPRRSKLNEETRAPEPLAGPSKTFTIDIPLPPDDMFDSLDTLANQHEGHIKALTPCMDYDSDESDSESWTFAHPPHPASTRPGTATNASTSTSGSVVGSSVFAACPTASGSGQSGQSGVSRVPVSPCTTSQSPHPDGNQYSKTTQQPQQRRQLRSVASLGLQPQFNLDSANALLQAFRTIMLPHFPCIELGAGGAREEGAGDTATVDVTGLARTRPFLLLAILAAASARVTLPGSGGGGVGGSGLYDEEFRKVLGLKLVAGGERSLELLQGLVVYVAWYPFHLRPKNKQAFQYVRMAIDMVNDLELDQDRDYDVASAEVFRVPSSSHRLAEMRTYLAAYLIISNFATTWNKTPALQFTEYTAKCCDVLEKHGSADGDCVLPWQVRLQRIMEEIHELQTPQSGHVQSEYQIALMLKGMESQLLEWERNMRPEIASNTSFRLAALSTRIYVSAAPLLRLKSGNAKPTSTPSSSSSSTSARPTGPPPFRADPARLASVIPLLQVLYELVLSLPAADINALPGPSWGCFIVSIVLGFRLSLPLPLDTVTDTYGPGSGWDAAAARHALRFDVYLDRLCRMGAGGSGDTGDKEGGGGTAREAEDGENIARSLAAITRGSGIYEKGITDVLSASKVILAVVRRKLHKRVVHSEEARRRRQHDVAPAAAATPESADPSTSCPSQASEPGLGDAMQFSLDPPAAGCPMLDGSLEPYFPYWDETFMYPATGGTQPVGGDRSGEDAGHAGQAGNSLHPGLWTTMTMSWAQHDINFDEF